MKHRVQQAAIRAALIGLFLAAYVWIWRPARDTIARHVMTPALAQVETARAQQFRITSAERVVEVRRARSGAIVEAMDTPAGILFVIATVVLLAVVPKRPYWLAVGAYQMALGAVMLGALAIGVGWAAWGFELFRFLDEVFYRATSLAAPLVALAVHRRGSDGGRPTADRGSP